MGNCFGLRNSGQFLLDPDVDGYSTEEDAAANNESPIPLFHPSPGLSIPASELTEEEQIQIVKRIDMLQFLPSSTYIPVNKEKLKECIICMYELKPGDEVRYLPCLHTYHRACIDDWLMRSFCCPTCLYLLEPAVLPTTNNKSPTEPGHPNPDQSDSQHQHLITDEAQNNNTSNCEHTLLHPPTSSES